MNQEAEQPESMPRPGVYIEVDNESGGNLLITLLPFTSLMEARLICTEAAAQLERALFNQIREQQETQLRKQQQPAPPPHILPVRGDVDSVIRGGLR